MTSGDPTATPLCAKGRTLRLKLPAPGVLAAKVKVGGGR
jgi:hypothetical protein